MVNLLNRMHFELTLPNKKWICYNIYRPPSFQNLEVFFDALTDSLSKVNKKYENVIVKSDFTIDTGLSYDGHDKLEEFCALLTYNL